MIPRCLILIALGLLAGIQVGCSGDSLPEAVSVAGKITLGGKPLSGATVGFNAISKELPAKYRYAASVTDDTGRYELKEIYPSEYMVTIDKPSNATAPGGSPEMAMASVNPKELSKYGSSSELRANVKDPTESMNFDLK